MALLQLALSLSAFIGLLGVGLLFVFVGIGQLTSQTAGISDPASTFLYAAGLIFSGFLLLPSAVFALLRLIRGRSSQVPPIFSGRWLLLASGLLIFIFPLVLLAGNLVATREKIAWFLLPPLHILAVSVPIFWLVMLGLRGLSHGSGQYSWGLFGAGLVLGPILILFLELALLAVFLVIAILFISRQPDLAGELTYLMQRLRNLPSNPEVLVQILQPYVLHPAVIVGVFAYIGIFVPLIEETIKPIGIWFLAGRRLSPADGFIAGLFSGAGYALFENLFLSSSAPQWMSLVLARVGTGAVHIFTASLVGWGLASAWGQGRYLRLGLSFVLAVCVHGLWNGLTLLTTGAQFISDTVASSFKQVGNFFPLGLGLLAIICVLMIWLFNRLMRRAIIAPLPLAIPPEDEQRSDRESEIDEV